MKKILLIAVAIVVLGLVAFFYGNKTEDIITEISVAEVTENIVGTWVSTEDPLSKVVFNEDGSQQDIYEDKVLVNGSWSLYEQEDADYNPTGVFLRTIIDEEAYEYAILEVNDGRLSISYLVRGNTLSYTRVTNSTEGFSQHISLENGFAIKHPNNWEVQEALKPQEMKAFHEIVISEEEGAAWRASVVIRMFENTDDLSIQEWWSGWLSEEDTKMEGCNKEESPCLALRDLVESEKETTLGSENAVEVTLFRFDHEEVCTYAVAGKNVYGVCAAGNNPNDENEFLNRGITALMIDSFEFVE